MHNLLVENLRPFKGELFVNEAVGSAVEHHLADDAYGEVDGWTEGKDHHQNDVSAHFQLTSLIHKGFTLEVHHPHTGKGGQADEDRVDEVEVEGAEEIDRIACGQAVARRAEGWHQGGGDGHTGYHVALLLGTEGYHAGQAAEQGDEHVVNRGRGAGQQLRLPFGHRADQEEDGGRGDAEERRDEVTLERAFHQFKVVQTHRQTYSHDRAHQW